MHPWDVILVDSLELHVDSSHFVQDIRNPNPSATLASSQSDIGLFLTCETYVFVSSQRLYHKSLHVYRSGQVVNGKLATKHIFFCLLEKAKRKREEEGKRAEMYDGELVSGHIQCDAAEGLKELWFCLCR